MWLTTSNLPSIEATPLIYRAQWHNCAFFRKGGTRTHNLSLAGKCFSQRQLGKMLFFKLLFLAEMAGIEPAKWQSQNLMPYLLATSQFLVLPTGFEPVLCPWKGHDLTVSRWKHLLIRLFSSDNALWSFQFWRVMYQLHNYPPLGFMSSRWRPMLFRYKTNQVKPV